MTKAVDMNSPEFKREEALLLLIDLHAKIYALLRKCPQRCFITIQIAMLIHRLGDRIGPAKDLGFHILSTIELMERARLRETQHTLSDLQAELAGFNDHLRTEIGRLKGNKII